MGLKYTDLASWQHWQDSQRRLHVMKDRLTKNRQPRPAAPQLVFYQRGDNPQLLVACDSNSPTNHHALLAPLAAEPAVAVLVAAPAHVRLDLPGPGWIILDTTPRDLSTITTMASIGDHLAVGAWAHKCAQERGWRQVVVQHGLLTPFSPPPPPNVEWLGWSSDDANYIADGRPDVHAHVTGSPMLAAAATHPAPHVSRFETPVFLGQLHGAELSRWSMTRSVTEFWRRTGAIYRPHPREEDKLSRLQHGVWKRMGMEFDDSPSMDLIARPVVSAFSTGILEASARGIPAWVFHVDPPAWLEDVWARYGMQPWGQPATAARDLGGPPSAVMQLITERG